MVEDQTVKESDLPNHLIIHKQTTDTRERGFQELSDDIIRRTLNEYDGQINKTAEALGIARTTIYRRMKKWSNYQN